MSWLFLISSCATKCCMLLCHIRLFTYFSAAKRKQAKIIYDMAKINIIFEKTTPFKCISP